MTVRPFRCKNNFYHFLSLESSRNPTKIQRCGNSTLNRAHFTAVTSNNLTIHEILQLNVMGYIVKRHESCIKAKRD